MIDKICTFLTNKIKKEMPEVDDEKAEIIMYGLQNIIGEIPKTFLVLFTILDADRFGSLVRTEGFRLV